MKFDAAERLSKVALGRRGIHAIAAKDLCSHWEAGNGPPEYIHCICIEVLHTCYIFFFICVLYIYIYVSLHTCCCREDGELLCPSQRLRWMSCRSASLPLASPCPAAKRVGPLKGQPGGLFPPCVLGSPRPPPQKKKKHRARIRIAHIQVGLRNKSGIVRLKKESPQFQFHVQAARREPVARLCRPSIDAWGERATSFQFVFK